MLGKSFRARCAVFESDHCHTLLIQIASCRNHFKAVRVVIGVGSSGVNNLYGLGCEVLRDVPFDIGFALVVLGIRHLSFRPNVFPYNFSTCFVAVIDIHKRHFGFYFAQPAHLAEKLHGTVKAQHFVSLVGIQMEFGRYVHPTQLPVNQCGSCRSVRVKPTVMETHRAGLPVEFENIAQLNISAVAFAQGRSACLPVGGAVGRSIDNCDVDVAGERVNLVHRLICPDAGTGAEQQSKVGTGRHRNRADFLRVISSFGRLPAHQPDGPLPVFPGSLINRNPLRTRSPVHQIDALEAQLSQLFRPVLYVVHIIQTLIRPPGNQHHTSSVALVGRRSLEPFKIGRTMFVCIEISLSRRVNHSRNLMPLCIRHLSLGPQVHSFVGLHCQPPREQSRANQQSVKSFHIIVSK